MNDLKDFLFSVRDIEWPGIKTYLSWRFYSDTMLAIRTPWMALGVIFFFVLIVFGIIMNIIYGRRQARYPYYKWLRGHLTNMSLWIGITGLFLILTRYEGIYFFSTRIVMGILILIMLIWLVRIIAWRVFSLPKLKRALEEQERKKKYLPKPKIKKLDRS